MSEHTPLLPIRTGRSDMVSYTGMGEPMKRIYTPSDDDECYCVGPRCEELADIILEAVNSHAKLIADNKRLREALENVREGLTINQPQLIKARLSMESEIRTINKALNESE